MRSTAWCIGERIPWLPDETLFSWCSRYHLLAGHERVSATCMQLFGRPRHGTAHDFPAGLEALVARAERSLGTADALIRDRTLLPFYGAFRSKELYDKAVEHLRGNGIESLKYQLGLLTSGVGAAHPLKACPACMREDHGRHGVAYWRRAHQWPAAWVCWRHGEPLHISPVKLDQRARFQFILPMDAGLVPWTALGGECSDRAMLLWQKLAAFGEGLCALTPGRLANACTIGLAVRQTMRKRGWLTAAGHIAWRRFEGELRQHAVDIARLPPFAMQVDLHAARAQLARIAAARSLTQPLRYLVWLSFLFEDFGAFVAAYDAVDGPAHSCDRVKMPVADAHLARSVDRSQDAVSEEAICELMEGGISTSALAKRWGVDPSTVAAWAAKAGLQTPRRPKVLDEAKRRDAIEHLATGASKSDTASSLGVSEVTITRLLRGVPGLQDQWHELRYRAAQEKARAAWIAIAQASQLLGVTAARRAEPAAFAWLYRNDREWLKKHSAGLACVRQAGNHSDAKRLQADRRYACALTAAFRCRTVSREIEPLNLASWALWAPGLKRVLRCPQAWPETMVALRNLLATRPPSSAEGLLV